jgi:hypothetical protein
MFIPGPSFRSHVFIESRNLRKRSFVDGLLEARVVGPLRNRDVVFTLEALEHLDLGFGAVCTRDQGKLILRQNEVRI